MDMEISFLAPGRQVVHAGFSGSVRFVSLDERQTRSQPRRARGKQAKPLKTGEIEKTKEGGTERRV
jgi:hypothetical protein